MRFISVHESARGCENSTISSFRCKQMIIYFVGKCRSRIERLGRMFKQSYLEIFAKHDLAFQFLFKGKLIGLSIGNDQASKLKKVKQNLKIKAVSSKRKYDSF